ncbi:hypothetical protein F5888DRAFT_1655179 [Russula emetica]|nr:hypothetical protein F5888DRAFT_1655179 [Russula emetica]
MLVILRSGMDRDSTTDTAEAPILELDYVVVAVTGAGKTIPFAPPLLVQNSPVKLALVISPMNTLETDQGCLDPLTCRHSSEGQKIFKNGYQYRYSEQRFIQVIQQ